MLCSKRLDTDKRRSVIVLELVADPGRGQKVTAVPELIRDSAAASGGLGIGAVFKKFGCRRRDRRDRYYRTDCAREVARRNRRGGFTQNHVGNIFRC